VRDGATGRSEPRQLRASSREYFSASFYSLSTAATSSRAGSQCRRVGDVASWAAVINQADIRLAQHMVGRLRVDPLQIRAEGGALAPALVVALDLDVHEADGAKLVLERLAGELWTEPAVGARVRLGQPVTIESAERGDTRPLFSLPRGGVHTIDLRIDLGAPGVRLLDEAVQASTQGPVMLALYFEARLGVLESSQAEDLPSATRRRSPCAGSGRRASMNSRSSCRGNIGRRNSPRSSGMIGCG
jgi:hypothetical protein